MWFECTKTTKTINIITNWVPYERTFKAHRFKYGAKSRECYVEFIWLAGDTLTDFINSCKQPINTICDLIMYIFIAILNVYISNTDFYSKDWNIGTVSMITPKNLKCSTFSVGSWSVKMSSADLVFLRKVNSMCFVFLIFNDNLSTYIHSINCFNSLFIDFIRFDRFLPVTNTFVSSANSNTIQLVLWLYH